MSSENLLAQVAELRRSGLTAVQIARELGLTKAQVQPMLRQVAGQGRSIQQPLPEPAERTLAGCWINAGWSIGLGLDGAPPEWAAGDRQDDDDDEVGSGGLATIAIARADRPSRASLCVFLVDVYCLGVKNALGPVVVSATTIDDRLRTVYGGHPRPPRPVPLELAQHLVHGAVDYATSLGFSPHEDFAQAAPYLGAPAGPCPIQFGRDGVPFYVSGPYDDTAAVMATLNRTAGSGNFHLLTELPIS
jgi:hypothetical protein